MNEKKTEIIMEPECCRNCQFKWHNTETNACPSFKKCGSWRTWFRSEWAKIRRSAAMLKKKK